MHRTLSESRVLAVAPGTSSVSCNTLHLWIMNHQDCVRNLGLSRATVSSEKGFFNSSVIAQPKAVCMTRRNQT